MTVKTSDCLDHLNKGGGGGGGGERERERERERILRKLMRFLRKKGRKRSCHTTLCQRKLFSDTRSSSARHLRTLVEFVCDDTRFLTMRVILGQLAQFEEN